jgi:hypothetical protein
MNAKVVVSFALATFALLAMFVIGMIWYFHYQTITKLLHNNRIEVKSLNLVYEFDSYKITKNLPFKIAFKTQNPRIIVMEGSGTEIDKKSIKFFNLNLDNNTIISSNIIAQTFKLKSPQKQVYEDENTGIRFEHKHVPQILIHYKVADNVNYAVFRSFDISKLLSTSFKLVQPFNITKISRKNKDGAFEEVAIFESTKSEGVLEILNESKRHFKFNLNAQILFTPWKATTSHAISEGEKSILESSAARLGKHHVNLMVDLIYKSCDSGNKAEMSKFFDAESVEASFKYHNNVFGLEIDSSNIISNNSKNQLTILNHNQLLNHNMLAMLAYLDPEILSFLKGDQGIKKIGANKFLDEYAQLEQMYFDVLKDIATSDDSNALKTNIDLDLKHIQNPTKHKIGNFTLADFKNKVLQKLEKSSAK